MKSSNSLPHDPVSRILEEIKASLPDERVEIERDYEEEDIQGLINVARSLLSEAVSEDNIRPSDLASIMNVHRSLVTRFFHSHGDIKISTLAIFARALNRKWFLTLEKRPSLKDKNYYSPTMVVSDSTSPQSLPGFAVAPIVSTKPATKALGW